MSYLTLNNKTDREYLIWKLLREWPATRYGYKNGRGLNRLSTKQLFAKEKQFQKLQSKQVASYVSFLNRAEA